MDRGPDLRKLALAMTIGAAACSDQPISGPVDSARLTIGARPAVSDTILARPVQAIVADLLDDAGRPLSGATVRFTSLPTALDQFQPSMLVGSEGSASLGAFVADTTNSRGRAIAVVQFGVLAGLGRITVEVPEFGLADTLAFTIQPGAAARVAMSPNDTSLYPLATVQIRGRVLDRYGNARTDPVTYSVTSKPAGIASVSGTGVVSASAPGRAYVLGVAGNARDSAGVSVVPRGTLAAVDLGGQFGGSALTVLDLDGSNRRQLAVGAGDNYQIEPEWSPSGSEIAITQPTGSPYVAFVALDGAISPLFANPPPDLGAHYWPSYSRDGQYLFFSGGGQPIWRAKRDGSAAEALTAGLTSGADYRPSASPDGRFVAFYSVGQLGVVVRVVEIGTKTLTPLVVQGRFPAWSPRGDLIAFLDNDGLGVKVMSPDGTGIRFISDPGRRYGDSQISWSPDGEWIAARSDRIDLIHVASGATLPIAGTANLYHPSWKPTAP